MLTGSLHGQTVQQNPVLLFNPVELLHQPIPLSFDWSRSLLGYRLGRLEDRF
jgi:hypothetical protein